MDLTPERPPSPGIESSESPERQAALPGSIAALLSVPAAVRHKSARADLTDVQLGSCRSAAPPGVEGDDEHTPTLRTLPATPSGHRIRRTVKSRGGDCENSGLRFRADLPPRTASAVSLRAWEVMMAEKRNHPILRVADAQRSCSGNILELRDRGLGPKDAPVISSVLSSNKKVEWLDLQGNKLGPDGARALASALAANNRITWLDLRGNGIGEDGARAMALAIGACRSLESVDLRDNRMGAKGARYIARALNAYVQPGDTRLQRILIANNEIDLQGLRLLSQSFSRLGLQGDAGQQFNEAQLLAMGD